MQRARAAELPTRRLRACELRWVTARDGEQVPVKLARHKDTPLDGSAPVLLYAYGAYESSFWPGFDGSHPESARPWRRVRARADSRRWRDGTPVVPRRLDAEQAQHVHRLHRRRRRSSRPTVWSTARASSRAGCRPVDCCRARCTACVLTGGVPWWPRSRSSTSISSMLDHDVPLTANEVDEWGDPRIKEQFDYMLSYSPVRERAERAAPGAAGHRGAARPAGA